MTAPTRTRHSTLVPPFDFAEWAQPRSMRSPKNATPSSWRTTTRCREIQDVAHHVGDSLALSRIAATAPQSTIVFCGVHFMAETAKILSPDKTVLIPDARPAARWPIR